MKSLTLIFFSIISFTSFAQQNKFIGNWEGRIEAGVSLRIVFEFSQNENGSIKGILRSPDQSPKALPTDTTYIIGDSIFVKAKKFGISYSGKLQDSIINGIFFQGGPLPLVLKRVATVAATRRPQTPVPPFTYNSQEVEYYNADKSIKFGATLTSPKIDSNVRFIKAPTFPTVMLITGSGAQDRDETILLHKPFAVIADYLTQQGFAVLRVDDRGVGKTTGNFATSTTADFAKDVEAGIDYLKTLSGTDTNRMGLIGHSEGGMIAPMVAVERKEIKYIVLLAGPGIPISQLMSEQIEAVSRSQGLSELASGMSAQSFDIAVEIMQGSDWFKIQTDTSIRQNMLKNGFDTSMKQKMIEATKDWAKQNSKVAEELKWTTPESIDNYYKSLYASIETPWYKYFLSFSPSLYLERLTCNVLALNGDKDIQVISKTNLAGIKASLKKSKSKKYEVKEMPGLNHLFQTCKKCTVAEYSEIEETISPAVLEVMGKWLKEQL